MEKDLNQHERDVVVVTGAGGGIGRGVADGLAKNGSRVAYLDVNPKKLSDLSGRDRTLSIVADISNPESIGEALDSVMRHWGGVHTLVNCAAVSSPHTSDLMCAKRWQRTIDVNLSGTFYADMAAIKHMRLQHYGRIINFSSVAGRRTSYNGNVAYTASKAGVIGLTRHLAYEYARDGITINAVCPGATLTPLLQSLADEHAIRERERTVPIGRLNNIADFVAAITYLCSEAAGGICGAILDIDGGAQLGWASVDIYFERRKELVERFVSDDIGG